MSIISFRNQSISICRLIIPSIFLQLMILPALTYAQSGNPLADQKKIIPKNRVVDPLSSSTIWIDQYRLKANPDNQALDIAVFNFRVNSTRFEIDFMDNARSMAVLDSILSNEELFKNYDVTLVTGSASPEGKPARNEVLAIQRAQAIKDCILARHPHVDRDKISTYTLGEDWEGLQVQVQRAKNMPGRAETLDILNSKLTGEQKIAKIKKLKDGAAYRYIETNIFPNLRGGVTCTFYKIEGRKDQPQIEYRERIDTMYVEKRDTIYIDHTKIVKVAADPKPRYIAVKTNMLYDLALLPNIAVEISLGQRWSVEAEWMHSWWGPVQADHYYHRIQVGGIEFRKWLGNRSKTPLTGHYFGFYGMGGTYDVRTGNDLGYLSDMSYSAGLTYGYSWPLSRRLNLELGVGIGYVGGEYKTYTFDPDNDRYPYVQTLNRAYFGPTKAKISLVWLIGSGVNKR